MATGVEVRTWVPFVDTENVRARTGFRLGAQSMGSAGGWTAEREVSPGTLYIWVKSGQGQGRERDGTNARAGRQERSGGGAGIGWVDAGLGETRRAVGGEVVGLVE